VHGRLLAAVPTGRVPEETADESASVKASACRILDTSENGMRLVWNEGQGGDVRVGDLLGIVEDGQRLQLAIARSVKVHREAGIELGVQKIHGSCGPVYCRAQTGEAGEELPALFIPAGAQDDMAATLIMAKGFYEAGKRLLIDSFGRQVSARAGRNVADSPVFDRFEFSADDSRK
jgi:hypothetical protein